MSDESVRVVCRFRPFRKDRTEDLPSPSGKGRLEDKNGFSLTLNPDKKSLSFRPGPAAGEKGAVRSEPHKFIYDRIFGEDSTQEQLFDAVAKDTVVDILKGYNGTIFAYGQTGSGKTHTMFGPNDASEEMRGIIPRCVDALFKGIEESQDIVEVTIKCSFLEIYKEVIRDLLNPKTKNLKIRETPAGELYVQGLMDEYCSSLEEIMELIHLGEKARKVASTNMNDVSSRSHSVFILVVTQKHKDGTTRISKLNLADLAGSEKIKQTGATGETLEEAKKINQSLSALGNCINALTDSKRTHIPFRDSTLTFLLKDSLGGNCKTTLVVCCSAEPSNAAETLSTLRFAKRAKQIKNTVYVNKQLSVEQLTAIVKGLRKELAQANKTIRVLRNQVRILQSGGTLSAEALEELEATAISDGRPSSRSSVGRPASAASHREPDRDEDGEQDQEDRDEEDRDEEDQEREPDSEREPERDQQIYASEHKGVHSQIEGRREELKRDTTAVPTTSQARVGVPEVKGAEQKGEVEGFPRSLISPSPDPFGSPVSSHGGDSSLVLSPEQEPPGEGEPGETSDAALRAQIESELDQAGARIVKDKDLEVEPEPDSEEYHKVRDELAMAQVEINLLKKKLKVMEEEKSMSPLDQVKKRIEQEIFRAPEAKSRIPSDETLDSMTKEQLISKLKAVMHSNTRLENQIADMRRTWSAYLDLVLEHQNLLQAPSKPKIVKPVQRRQTIFSFGMWGSPKDKDKPKRAHSVVSPTSSITRTQSQGNLKEGGTAPELTRRVTISNIPAKGEDPGPIVWRSILWKKPVGWTLRRAWQKRLVVLRKTRLEFYFLDQKETDNWQSVKDDLISLELQAFVDLTPKQGKVKVKRSKEMKHSFDVITPKQEYNLHAETEEDANAWVDAIKSVIEVLSKEKGLPSSGSSLSSSGRSLSRLPAPEKEDDEADDGRRERRGSAIVSSSSSSSSSVGITMMS